MLLKKATGLIITFKVMRLTHHNNAAADIVGDMN
jgi:hypothetical protein